MLTITKKVCAGTLGLALLLAAGSTANAQSRFRDSRFGGSMSTKEKAAYIGGGAAAGALIGGLLGGKKGAVIGGLLGAGGGTGYVYYKGKQEEDRYGRYDGYRYYGRSSGVRGYRGYNDGRFFDSRNYRNTRNRCVNGFRR